MFANRHCGSRLWCCVVLSSIWLLHLTGCQTARFVELREKPRNPIAERLTLSAYGDAGPSNRTRQFLASTGYAGGDDYLHMLRHCRSHQQQAFPGEALHATAELCYLAAEDTRRHDRGLAQDLYADSAHAAWSYMTRVQSDGRLPDPNGQPHRETAELYNVSLEQMLRMMKDDQDGRLTRCSRLPVSARTVHLEVPFPTEWLNAEQLGEFEFVSDYQVQNLRNHHITSGLGVPVMIRRRRPQQPDQLEQYYDAGICIPATLVARFDSSTTDGGSIHLQLLDPRETDGVVVQQTLLPLETDLSTPLAWFLTDPQKSLLDTFGFLRPDKARELEGLYMVAPYDPDRIPVLMVHGLWSSPMTWMEMFNDLQSDPELRERYQFWFYMYPTGEPLTFAAANLRDRLKEVRERCDPHGRNAKLDQMVMVGHSMGGLMSYLMTVESEDKLWNALSNKPVEQIQADPAVRQQIRRVFFFESDRSIDRIVTIASPFNGSGYANRFTQWLSGSIVSLPNTTSRLSRLIYDQNQQSFFDRIFAPRTSLDSLNKHSAVVKLVNHSTTPEDVLHHNVVGVRKGKSIKDWTDGVVTARSATRPDADTEVRVKAGHSEIHRHPDTIAEVRRVLLEHLQQVDSQPRSGIIQIRNSRSVDAGTTRDVGASKTLAP